MSKVLLKMVTVSFTEDNVKSYLILLIIVSPRNSVSWDTMVSLPTPPPAPLAVRFRSLSREPLYESFPNFSHIFSHI